MPSIFSLYCLYFLDIKNLRLHLDAHNHVAMTLEYTRLDFLCDKVGSR